MSCSAGSVSPPSRVGRQAAFRAASGAGLSVALAFAGDPAAIFLDEPTAGLDVESRRSVWAEIDRYSADGGTVLLTTHYLDEAERLAGRIVLLAQGRVVAEGSPTQLADQARVSGLEEAFLALTETFA